MGAIPVTNIPKHSFMKHCTMMLCSGIISWLDKMAVIYQTGCNLVWEKFVLKVNLIGYSGINILIYPINHNAFIYN